MTIIDVLKYFEGFRARPYYCSGNKLTIGYGHTETVTPTMRVTEQEGELLLMRDAVIHSEIVDRLVTVPLEKHEREALLSFVFNFGETKFRRSTLLKLLNAGDYRGAADEFPKWNRVSDKRGGTKVSSWQVHRRKVERAMFLGQDFEAIIKEGPK